MNLRTRLSRSEGYRLLGMYDESILILEDIPPGEERWDSLVVEARYNTYRDAEVWELANAMSGLMCRRHPSSLKWCMNYVDGMIKLGETKEAIEALGGQGSVRKLCKVHFQTGQMSGNSGQCGGGEEAG